MVAPAMFAFYHTRGESHLLLMHLRHPDIAVDVGPLGNYENTFVNLCSFGVNFGMLMLYNN